MAHFDLIEAGWLPVVTAGGATAELGLRETLARAHELRELYDPSPLVTVTLHRLLLAILHRAYDGPASISQWRQIWDTGRFDPDRLGRYLERWHDRFDLFDPERPFYQVPEMAEVTALAYAADLAHEQASGNNPTLFDHSSERYPRTMTPAAAARYLVARQAVSYGGGHNKPFNLSDSPLARGLSVLAQGENLFETLTLNLERYDRERPIPWREQDRPAWERTERRRPVKEGTPPDGLADHLTWPSRRIHLMPEGEPTAVARCQIAQNLKEQDDTLDPFKCYRRRETGFVSLTFAEDRALWRDAHILFARYGGDDRQRRSVRLFDWLAEIDRARRRGQIRVRPRYTLAAYGATPPPGKANIELWRREQLPLPLAYLDAPRLVTALRRAVGLAEQAGRDLWSGLRLLAQLLVTPTSDEQGARQPDKSIVNNQIKALDGESRYWAQLEGPFTRLMVALPEDRRQDADGDWVYGDTALPVWATAVKWAAQEAFRETTLGLGASALTLKAVAKADQVFGKQLAMTMRRFADRQEGDDDNDE